MVRWVMGDWVGYNLENDIIPVSGGNRPMGDAKFMGSRVVGPFSI